jgi:hypothetical protein
MSAPMGFAHKVAPYPTSGFIPIQLSIYLTTVQPGGLYPPGDDEAGQPTNDREYHTLSQQLPDQTESAGAKAETNRNLSFTRRCPRKSLRPATPGVTVDFSAFYPVFSA